jgi:CDP-diacylglycerol--glycerol-3-phosphate 3-phosphatidyltransferase
MIPNCLTGLRVVLAGAFAACVALADRDGSGAGGAWVALLAALALTEEATDLLDGMIARRLDQASRLGGILDPLADSLARLTMYFSLALVGWVPLAVPLVMGGRDIIVAYTRIVQALTGGKTSARLSGKLKAIIQGGGIGGVLALAWAHGRVGAEMLQWLRWVLGGGIIGVTVWSLADYLRGAWPGLRQMARERPVQR